MKLRRPHDNGSHPVALPGHGEAVTITTSNGGRIPARVIEVGPDMLQVAILVPTRPFSRQELDGMVVEFHSLQGRIRLTGVFSVPDPSERDVLALEHPRSIEVVQEREYVRIKAARPVLVYSAGSQLEVRSFTVDLSGGGLLLAGPDTLSAGDELSLQLSIEPGGHPITGRGKVVRIDDQGRRAITFTEITAGDRRRLVRFIFECQRAERRRGLTDSGDGHG